MPPVETERRQAPAKFGQYFLQLGIAAKMVFDGGLLVRFQSTDEIAHEFITHRCSSLRRFSFPQLCNGGPRLRAA